MNAACPCCGSELTEVPTMALLREIALPRHQLQILSALIDAFPRGCTKEFLIDVLYGSEPDGGPLTANNIISIYFSHLRPVLADYGWTVSHGRNGPGAHGRYRLMLLDEVAV